MPLTKEQALDSSLTETVVKALKEELLPTVPEEGLRSIAATLIALAAKDNETMRAEGQQLIDAVMAALAIHKIDPTTITSDQITKIFALCLRTHEIRENLLKLSVPSSPDTEVVMMGFGGPMFGGGSMTFEGGDFAHGTMGDETSSEDDSEKDESEMMPAPWAQAYQQAWDEVMEPTRAEVKTELVQIYPNFSDKDIGEMTEFVLHMFSDDTGLETNVEELERSVYWIEKQSGASELDARERFFKLIVLLSRALKNQNQRMKEKTDVFFAEQEKIVPAGDTELVRMVALQRQLNSALFIIPESEFSDAIHEQMVIVANMIIRHLAAGTDDAPKPTLH